MRKMLKHRSISAVIRQKYANKWVAMTPDYKKLLAAGNTLGAVLAKTKQQEKVVLKILPNLGYVPRGVQG